MNLAIQIKWFRIRRNFDEHFINESIEKMLNRQITKMHSPRILDQAFFHGSIEYNNAEHRLSKLNDRVQRARVT